MVDCVHTRNTVGGIYIILKILELNVLQGALSQLDLCSRSVRIDSQRAGGN